MASAVARGVVTFLTVATALAVGGAITAYMPDKDEQERPFVRTGAGSDSVDARLFDAQVLGVRGGTKLAGGGAAHDTSGVWILVTVRVTAKKETSSVGYAALIDGDGRTFRATERVTLPVGGRLLQPGLPVRMELAFEVPKDVPLPLAIRLAEPPFELRVQAIAQIDLGLGAPDLALYAGNTDVLRLKETAVDGLPSGAPSASGGPA
ncbi:DUF4352 domain-containing protein [Hamadaea tsunoensis]|uniref:hypothetical protein n=1 Tax=Hamadaea tsunoensis TaxID=53368 RepID=UPI000410A3F4|nr:hypothetical protein [Hamadaea tsunoensis]